MDSELALRLKCLVRLEQLQSGIAHGDPHAVADGRDILRRIVSKGSAYALAQVFRGILLAWDELDEEMERML